jgi:DNA-binding LacI/PurR family transcriptional regulator
MTATDATGPGADPKREATMADVAERVGVSRQLVSLVMRGAAGPSEQTRQRVLQAADELGYRPHLGAQVLRQARSLHLGVGYVPSNFNESEIVEAMYPAAQELGYGLVLSAQTPDRGTDRVLAELRGHRCAGVILIGSTVSDDELIPLIRQAPVPVAVIGQGELNDHYDVLLSDGALGIAQCVRHLHELGHRDTAFIDVPSIAPARRRLDGYLRACHDLGLSPRVIRTEQGLPEEEGAAAARQIIASNSVPTAIVCANDQSALGTAMVLLEAGFRVPWDVSITGYDDSRIASWSFMDLTSARQDPEQLGSAAVEAVLRRMADPSKSPVCVVIEPSLVIRTSTAPPAR